MTRLPSIALRAAAVALAALAFLLLAGCTPASGPGKILSSEKTFTSIVFGQADNAGLAADCRATWNAAQRMWITAALASDFDAGQMTATFALSAGARCYVGDTLQVSGSTVNDFSNPIVYRIVAEDGSEALMTVKIKKDVAGPAAGKVRIRVGCWNLNDCDMDDGITRYAEIAAIIKAAGINVILLCEVQQDDENGADISNLQDALSSAGWPLEYQTSVETGGEDDVAVLSSYPIASTATIVTPSGSEWPRPMMRADVSINGQVLHLLVGHLKAMEDNTSLMKRRAQASALASYIRTAGLSSGYVVIGGDMNTVAAGDRADDATISATYPQATLDYLQLLDDADSTNNFWASNENAIPGESTHRLGSVLDHLILSPAATGAYVTGTVDVYGTAACSDHFPVYLDLDL